MRPSVCGRPDLGANHEGARRDRYLGVPTLVRTARKLCADYNIAISGSRLRKLVRRFIDEGRTNDHDDDVEEDLRDWLLTYADPTGQQAVANLTREGR